MGLGKANRILGRRRSLERNPGQVGRTADLPLLMRRQTPVGIDTGQISPSVQGTQAVDRRLEVASRGRPVCAAAVKRGQLVFDAGHSQAACGRSGCSRLQAVQRGSVFARQSLQIADSFVQDRCVRMAKRQGSPVV